MSSVKVKCPICGSVKVVSPIPNEAPSCENDLYGYVSRKGAVMTIPNNTDQSNADSNRGPWRDCNLIESECKKKGYCIGHTLPKNTDSNAKAGSEELESILDELVYQCTGKRVRTGHHQAGTVPYDELHNAIERINILIAQASAQAEMRNAESLIKHETYGALNVIDFLTRKGNINNETRLATIEIVSGWESDGLAQLRAQGGENK